MRTAAGRFAVLDFGGAGRDCLLIHGTGQNAVAWRQFAAVLAERYRVVAFDLRGHGRTLERSSDPEQYWRDIAPLAAALGMSRPILIGHSSGAYAATAHVASGGAAAAVVCVDGFTLDMRAEAPTAANWAAAKDRLFDLFRYGWRATAAERDAYVEEVVAAAPTDAFNAGVAPDLLRSMLLRCFVEQNGMLVRRPTLEEIEVVSAPRPDAEIGPYRAIYEKIDVPLVLVWAEHGLSATRRASLESIAAAAANRELVAIDASHNVPLQRPVELAKLVSARLPR